MKRKNKTAISIAGDIIRTLMNESKISESELARQTDLPQTTINRLLLGGTTDPRANTLKPIADFFGVTIGQLCGFEPITIKIKGTTQAINRSAWQSIPIIEWELAKAWVFKKKSITPNNHQRWITTERAVSQQSFALPSLRSMEPRFRVGSILIVDPEAKFKEGHFIIVMLNQLEIVVRKVVIDGYDVFLKSFEEPHTLTKLTKKHFVVGTIVESRLDTYNE